MKAVDTLTVPGPSGHMIPNGPGIPAAGPARSG
jgi:hypothetical protein